MEILYSKIENPTSIEQHQEETSCYITPEAAGMIAIRPVPLPCRSDIYRARPLMVPPPCLAVAEMSILSIAHHEAGHAVAALALGLSPIEETISGSKGFVSLYGTLPAMDSDVEPSKTLALEEQTALLLLLAADALPTYSNTDRALTIATVLMAGTQSELLLAGLDSDGLLMLQCNDFKKSVAVLRQAFGTEVPLAWCQANARAILSQRWAEVEAIVHDLMTKGFWKPEANDAGANI